MKRRRVILLGATGSIGSSTLTVLRAHPERLELVGCAARSSARELLAIASAFGCPNLALTSEEAAAPIRDQLGDSRLFEGPDAMTAMVEAVDADVVLVAVVGTAALVPTLRAIRRGCDVALASKEILVLAGDIVTTAAREAGVRLLPTDSEHNAVFQCLEGYRTSDLDQIILTASGGPFRNHSAEQLRAVTPAEALRHPNWTMGPKITVDSATMANKGLEVIEAHWLFGCTREKIDVVVHPQSIVHSMVRFLDGSVLAQMSPPSMVFAIQHCLLYPERAACPEASLDFSTTLRLDFEPPDPSRFPCLRLAFESLSAGGNAPGIFNTANEVAVEAFLDGRLSFNGIPALIEKTLETTTELPVPQRIEPLLELEADVRQHARALLPTVEA